MITSLNVGRYISNEHRPIESTLKNLRRGLRCNFMSTTWNIMRVPYDRMYLNLENATAQHAVCTRLEQQWVVPILIPEIMEELLAIVSEETRR